MNEIQVVASMPTTMQKFFEEEPLTRGREDNIEIWQESFHILGNRCREKRLFSPVDVSYIYQEAYLSILVGCKAHLSHHKSHEYGVERD